MNLRVMSVDTSGCMAMNDIVIRHTICKTAKAELDKSKSDIRPGDVIVATRGWKEGRVCLVKEMTKKGMHLLIWSGTGWEDEEELEEYRDLNDYVKTDMNPATIETDILEMVKDVGKSFGGLNGEESGETALAVSGGKEQLLSAERALQTSMDKAMIARAIMERKSSQLLSIISDFEKGLTKVRKVLHVAELYLGIDEEILQIKQGEPAPPSTPISIRQMVLYMDEEVGDHTDGGLDCDNIENFDKWVCEPGNIAKIIPELKGVVALRTRHFRKDYHCDVWTQGQKDTANNMTYLLIRNGDNLYRIWMTESIHPRLFPRKDEFVVKPIEWIDGTKTYSPFADKEIEESEFQYKKYGVMIQGLMMRTEVFNPTAHPVDLFRPETWEGLVNFVRDDEMLLPTGRLSWHEWLKEINSKITVGSRVVWFENLGYHERLEEIRERTGYRTRERINQPAHNIYTVVGTPRGVHNPECMRFYYNPGDTIFKGYDTYGKYIGMVDRKQRIGWQFYANEVINYDQIDLADIDFYINCRTERHHYNDMMGLLWTLRKIRLKEMEHEKGLVVMLSESMHVPEDFVWRAIDWWKYKNKWKRSLSDDDAKALRMIRQKVRWLREE